MKDVSFEDQYKSLIDKVVNFGTRRVGRNGETLSIFGSTLGFDLQYGTLPIITGRKMFTKGVLGEYAAIVRGPKNIQDFEMWGCNYWKTWAEPETGKIRVDYGNKWRDFNGFMQLEWLLEEIRNNPTSRRLLLSSWDPSNLVNLDLPCCHYMYQFYVRDGHLDMMWHQRSADLMVGVPSDALFAAAMLLSFAGATDLKPGKCTMFFGDTHIYKEHYSKAIDYRYSDHFDAPKYEFKRRSHPQLFIPSDLKILDHSYGPTIKFELKA